MKGPMLWRSGSGTYIHRVAFRFSFLVMFLVSRPGVGKGSWADSVAQFALNDCEYVGTVTRYAALGRVGRDHGELHRIDRGDPLRDQVARGDELTQRDAVADRVLVVFGPLADRMGDLDEASGD